MLLSSEFIKSYLGISYVGLCKFANVVQMSYVFLTYSQDFFLDIPKTALNNFLFVS